MTDIAVSRQALAAAARALAHAGRWHDAAALAAAPPEDPLLALTAAQVSVESDWFAGTSTTADRLITATRLAAGLDDAGRWDLAFVELRHGYRTLLMADGSARTSPEAVQGLAADLRATAPDAVRQGWAAMYQGLIADNLLDQPDVAPDHYHAALRAGAGPDRGDGLLAREALRHLGGHDHDAGRDEVALDRWRRATELGAAAGNVPGTLSQQLLLAVLARAVGNEAGAVALATEIARWATAIGAAALARQATAFIDGIDPTAPPPAPATTTPVAKAPEAAAPAATTPEAAALETAAPAATTPEAAALETAAAAATTPRAATPPVAAALEAAGPTAVESTTSTSTAVADVPLLVSFMTAPLATTPRQ
ncbi:hypothetical protein [Dactylosporangium cerinum]